MTEYRLSYATIIRLSDHIAEVIVDEGVEMDLEEVEEYHKFLQDTFVAPFAILVNRKNSYTYSFAAQQKLATLPQFKAIALLVYNKSAEISSQALRDIKRDQPWNSQIFEDRDEALGWLNEQLAAE